MNCKPGEMAYIRIPEGCLPEMVRVQLNGIPVVTVRLLAHEEPFWDINPPLIIHVDRPCRDSFGRSFSPGSLYVGGLPDAFLIPIRGDRQPTSTTTPKVLETA